MLQSPGIATTWDLNPWEQQEKPLQWEACALQLESSPHWRLLVKSLCSKEDPVQKKKRKEKKTAVITGKPSCIWGFPVCPPDSTCSQPMSHWLTDGVCQARGFQVFDVSLGGTGAARGVFFTPVNREGLNGSCYAITLWIQGGWVPLWNDLLSNEKSGLPRGQSSAIAGNSLCYPLSQALCWRAMRCEADSLDQGSSHRFVNFTGAHVKPYCLRRSNAIGWLLQMW